jgi:hypothetical protein
MGTLSIRSLRPNVSRDEALQAFSAGSFTSLYWRMRSGPMQRIADAYVPFWLYRVRYEMGRALHTRLFALDAVDGSLDLFEFPRAPQPDQLVNVETRNHLRPALASSQAEALLRDKALRSVLQQGIFKLRHLKFEIARETADFYMPYWLGFYGSDGIVRCRVMDAVRRRMEGAKAASFFEEWLVA